MKEFQELEGLGVRVLKRRRVERRLADAGMARQPGEQRVIDILEPHCPIAEHAALDLALAERQNGVVTRVALDFLVQGAHLAFVAF